MSGTPDSLPSLESVLCTEELSRRPSRPPDYEKESRALAALAKALADSPGTILQALADSILREFESGSAGVSLVTPDGKRFYWPAIAGTWKPHIGGGTPRDFGPCGDVLDRNCPLLFRHFERRYAYFLPVTPLVEECLLVPIYVEGKAVGTIWALHHEDRPAARKFDSEDLRLLVSLGSFASAAYQVAEKLRALTASSDERQASAQTMVEMNEALMVSSVRQHELAEQARKAGELLRASEIRFRRLFQSSKDGIMILDAITGKIIEANAYMIGLLGREMTDLVGKELWEIGVFKDIAFNKLAFAMLQKHGYLRYEHLPVQKPNGEVTQVEFINTVYIEDQRHLAQCLVRDISARFEMEKQIKAQAEALADQSRRKDEFLAMLSHELRNPLAPIRTAVQLLRLQEPATANPIQRQAREVIERQVTNLTRLVGDMLEVSRALTGRIHLSPQLADLNQILRHAVETAMPLIEHGSHSLKLNLCAESSWTMADPTRIEEVFVNLLSNAAKYTSNGGRIEVTCEHTSENGDKLALVRVRDTGEGIDPSLLPYIFDLFTQANRTLDRTQGGLGIGLCLAKRFVELHGGTIEARSEGPGKGSEFVVRLKLAPAPGEAPPVPVHDPALPQGLRVLIVDDNVDGCTMLATLLRLRGHEVRMAFTGPSGLAIAEGWRPDVALLDIGLPGISGYDIARSLRSGAVTRIMRLVAVTGYGAEKDRALAEEAGFDAHLLKPVDLAVVEKLLEGWKQPQASGAP